MEFIDYPSIPRLYREMFITEKLDGTNGCLRIDEDGSFAVQSRKRFITPDDDVHGLADWAYRMQGQLVEELGPGVWFGEWFGHRINRGYGLKQKHFALFHRKYRGLQWTLDTPGLTAVPVLYSGEFAEEAVRFTSIRLREHGSVMVPGYDKPEGIVVTHVQGKQQFKYTFDGDGHKG